jgi:hypothetical protein
MRGHLSRMSVRVFFGRPRLDGLPDLVEAGGIAYGATALPTVYSILLTKIPICLRAMEAL